MADRDDLDPNLDAWFQSLREPTDDLLDAPPPAAIRRRGERRRTRRRAGIAAGTLGIGALAATSVMSLQGWLPHQTGAVSPAASAKSSPSARPSLSTSKPPRESTSTPPSSSGSVPSTSNRPASTPSMSTASSPVVTPSTSALPTATPAASTTAGAGVPLPTFDDLPTAAELARGEQPSLVQDAETETLPQEPFSTCQLDLGDLAQKKLLVRHFTSSDQKTQAYAVVFGYDTTEQAVAARRILRTWYSGCAARLQADGKDARQSTAVVTPVSKRAAKLVDPVDGASFREVSWREPGADSGNFEEATVIQLENRLEWVVYLTTGAQDNAWDTASGGPVGQVYPGIQHAASWADKLLP